MDWGSVADWAGSAGGLLAVCAAVVSWRTSEKLVKLEGERDRMREIAAERSQAERITVVGVECGGDKEKSAYGAMVVNGSNAPIYDVKIESQLASGARSNAPLELAIVPPGRFIILCTSGGWGVLADQDTAQMKFSVVAKGRGGKMITCVTFADAGLREWRLVGGRNPQRVGADI